MTVPMTPCLNSRGLAKRTYRSPAKARQEARKLQGSAWVKAHIRAYQCPRCGLWHVTGSPYDERADHIDRRRHEAA